MQNILITGVSSGIGKFLTEKLCKNYNIFGISRNNPNLEKITFYTCDLINEKDINTFTNKIKDQNIYFDMIIFNAGVGFFDYFGNISNKKNLQMLQTNLYSPILMLQNLLKNLNKNAKIIFIGSIASKKFFNFGAVYQASKFGLRGFAGSIKNEFKDKKIYIINPTIVKTNFFGGQESKFNYKQTKIIDIFKTVENILNGKENRFEIDL